MTHVRVDGFSVKKNDDTVIEGTAHRNTVNQHFATDDVDKIGDGTAGAQNCVCLRIDCAPLEWESDGTALR